MEQQGTTTLTRGVCTECGDPVNYVDFNFLGPEPEARLRPCGHAAPLRFEDDPRWT